MTSTSDAWIAIFLLGVVSVACRSFFLVLGSRVVLSERVQRGIRYAPLGALVAVIVPEIALVQDQSGALAFSAASPQLWGGLCASAAFWRWRSIIVTVASGMAVYTLVRLLA